MDKTKQERLKEEIEDHKVSASLINKVSSVLYDGKQFMIKIPIEISRFFKLKKGDKFEFFIDVKKKKEEDHRFRIK
tara:strand:- start:6090 stop:6317 length:228 start_codon:yes stop_codon:yes gene_type:complete